MNRRTVSLIAGAGCLLILLLIAVPVVLGMFSSRGLIQIPGSIVQAPTETFNTVAPPVSGGNIQATAGTGFATPTFIPALAGTGTQAVAGIPNTGVMDSPLTGLYAQMNPGVVSINVQIQSQDQTGEAAGSGFILAQEGYIATNHHVISGAQTVLVTFFDGTQANAKVIGSDPSADLAVIKVDQIVSGAHPIPLGDSDQVKVGENVIAIGNPFALGTSMSAGIVSAVGRVIPSGFTQFNIPEAIQTDAAINPGNSGGPLINMRGEVIGVNAQIRTANGVDANTGVGFAIPSNILKLIYPSLIQSGSYQWPWLGISGSSVNEVIMEANHLKSQKGAYIHQISPGGPAEKAGLHGSTQVTDVNGFQAPVGGDVITAVDGKPVNNFNELLSYIAFKKPGDKVTVTVVRGGKESQTQITLEPRPQNSTSDQQQPGSVPQSP